MQELQEPRAGLRMPISGFNRPAHSAHFASAKLPPKAGTAMQASPLLFRPTTAPMIGDHSLPITPCARGNYTTKKAVPFLCLVHVGAL
eukprot:1160799-Pelagomonas_calceolata.AAC.1